MVFSRSFHEFALSEANFGLQLLLQLFTDVFHFDIFLEIDALGLLDSNIETHLGHLIHLVRFLFAIEVLFIEDSLLILKPARAVKEHLVDVMGLLLAFIHLGEDRVGVLDKGTALDRALEGSCHLERGMLHFRWTDIDVAACSPWLLLTEEAEGAIELILHLKWVEFGQTDAARVLPPRTLILLCHQSLELVACVIELFHSCFRSHGHFLVPGVAPRIDIVGCRTRIHDAISVIVA